MEDRIWRPRAEPGGGGWGPEGFRYSIKTVHRHVHHTHKHQSTLESLHSPSETSECPMERAGARSRGPRLTSGAARSPARQAAERRRKRGRALVRRGGAAALGRRRWAEEDRKDAGAVLWRRVCACVCVSVCLCVCVCGVEGTLLRRRAFVQ